MTQIELNKALDGISDCSDSLSGEQVLGVSTNSKEIIPGFIFVAIKGTKFDGNDFIDEALDLKIFLKYLVLRSSNNLNLLYLKFHHMLYHKIELIILNLILQDLLILP